MNVIKPVISSNSYIKANNTANTKLNKPQAAFGGLQQEVVSKAKTCRLTSDQLLNKAHKLYKDMKELPDSKIKDKKMDNIIDLLMLAIDKTYKTEPSTTEWLKKKHRENLITDILTDLNKNLLDRVKNKPERNYIQIRRDFLTELKFNVLNLVKENMAK